MSGLHAVYKPCYGLPMTTRSNVLAARKFIANAKAEQAVHESAECPTCHGAVHPAVLTYMGHCTTCHMVQMRAAIA